jgi:hypothetical protein
VPAARTAAATAKTLNLVGIAISAKICKERRAPSPRGERGQSNRVPRVTASEQKDGDKPVYVCVFIRFNHNNSKFAHITVTDLHGFHVLLKHIGLIFAGWGTSNERVWL